MVNKIGKRFDSKISVTCESCGKTKSFRAGRVAVNDYYLCDPCDRADLYEHPPEPEGQIRIIDFFAAKGFTGFTTRLPTPDEKLAIERAKNKNGGRRTAEGGGEKH